jgi:protein TonB
VSAAALRRPRRLLAAALASVLAHAGALAAFGAVPFERARPGAFRDIEVALVAAAPVAARAPRAVMRRAPAATAAVTPVAEASPEAPAGGDARDEPLVEARHDVATLDNPRPPYPLAARRLGQQGRVVLRAHVDADGRCEELRLAASSGHRLLDDAALATVRRWRFLPATRAGIAVASWVEVPIAFRLDVPSDGAALHATR